MELRSNSPFVDVAIADAIRHVRSERLWFNGNRHSFLTVANQYQYQLPADFLGIRGKVYCTSSTDSTSRYRLQPATADELEEYLYEGYDGYDSIQNTGVPRKYAIDLMDKVMLIGPIPSDGGDGISFKYTKDLGTPTYTISTTNSAPPSLSPTVTLAGPNGETLESTYKTEWFGEGFKLVKERALYELFTRFHAGTDDSAQQGTAALTRYLEELQRLRGETAQTQSNITVRKYL